MGAEQKGAGESVWGGRVREGAGGREAGGSVVRGVDRTGRRCLWQAGRAGRTEWAEAGCAGVAEQKEVCLSINPIMKGHDGLVGLAPASLGLIGEESPKPAWQPIELLSAQSSSR